MAIRFVDVGSDRPEPAGANHRQEPLALPAASGDPPPSGGVAAADAAGVDSAPVPDEPPPRAKPKGRPRKDPAPVPDRATAPAAAEAAQLRLDGILLPDLPEVVKPAPKPRRHRRGFG